MYEKELYPAAEKILKTKKNCLAEYVGTELSLKRGRNSLRAEGVWSINKKSVNYSFGKIPCFLGHCHTEKFYKINLLYDHTQLNQTPTSEATP